MAVRGITLEPGSVVVLSLDGTMVYVESVCPTFAAVIALPEQPTERADDRVFTPGKVGAKKISPFSTTDKTVAVSELSARNREFIGTYESLRVAHGPHYIHYTPEEAAAMSVKKVTGGSAPRASKGTGKRALKRAKTYLAKCATCGEQPGHPNHPGVHTFVPPTVEAPVDSSGTEAAVHTRRPKGGGSSPRSAGASTYTLISPDLTAAQAQPRGDKFNEGNRSHRVVVALAGLPNSTGTLDEVIAALCADGKTPPANPAKVVRRTLNQLTTPAFGAVVTKA